ncbi:MAG: sterol desaturase family protein, partial [Gemmatimonadetes bacterium]|nr:sterol desaturase family protein [Gemmatimonadota bacterium]
MELFPPITKPVASAIALGLLWAVEGALPMFEGRERRARHGVFNLALGLVNALVASALFATATLFVTEWARSSSFGLLHWVDLGPVWTVVAALVLLDLWQYVWHRLNHQVP